MPYWHRPYLLVTPEQFLYQDQQKMRLSLLMNSYSLVASLALTTDSQHTSRRFLIMSKVSFCRLHLHLHNKPQKQRRGAITATRSLYESEGQTKVKCIRSWHFWYWTFPHRLSMFLAVKDLCHESAPTGANTAWTQHGALRYERLSTTKDETDGESCWLFKMDLALQKGATGRHSDLHP